MKTVDVFAMKEDRVQRAGQILIVGRLLHTLRPVVRYELHPSALYSSRERPLCLQLSGALCSSLWDRGWPWDSKSLVAGNNPDVVLVPRCHWFMKYYIWPFVLAPHVITRSMFFLNQSADCSCTWMPKCKCRLSAVGVECGSEVVEPRLHILNICEKAVRAKYSKEQSTVLLKFL